MTPSEVGPHDSSDALEYRQDGSPVVPASLPGTNLPTLKSIGIIDIEAQVLRDGLPLTRPTRWASGLASFKPGTDASWKLFPGAASQGEPVNVALYHGGFVAPHWINVHALIQVDGVNWPNSKPGQVFVDDEVMWPYGGWSCVINFPIMSDRGSLHGVHSLLLRTIVEG